ncbi:MAG: hypothetical protein J7J17_02810 [Hadesarchaea archaeon]|nr:hypothetical protein [Hadesarchaea archaeon]
MEKGKSRSLYNKSFLSLFFLILNSVVWFYLVVILVRYTEPVLIPSATSLSWIFYFSVLISTLAGAAIADKLDRARFIRFWVVFGVISSLFPLVLSSFGELGTVVLFTLWGFAFGVGFPSCLALFSLLTDIEKRGSAGGIISFSTYVVLFLAIMVIPSELLYFSLMLAGWRALALWPLFHLRVNSLAESRSISYLSILRRSKFLLYFCPWLIFCVVNYFGVQIVGQSLGSFVRNLMIFSEFLVGGIFCLVAGMLMDLRGRRPTIIVGAVALGLGYALLSFSPASTITQVFYVIVDSVAFGIFTVAFVLVVWGDMSAEGLGEKFYALGYSCIPLAVILSQAFASWLKTVNVGSALSLVSFFLFLAAVPLFFAPELLPEKVIRKREIQRYIEEAKEVVKR